jgi:hypothetical protein
VKRKRCAKKRGKKKCAAAKLENHQIIELKAHQLPQLLLIEINITSPTVSSEPSTRKGYCVSRNPDEQQMAGYTRDRGFVLKEKEKKN